MSCTDGNFYCESCKHELVACSEYGNYNEREGRSANLLDFLENMKVCSLYLFRIR